ncbi:MAG: type IV secretion system protein [Nitrospinae bacterium]|nr:type IV secretion system protein [Nitrospinota bacterium]
MWFFVVSKFVINFLLGAITWIDDKTYEVPPTVFEFWKKLSEIALSLVVLAGALSAFLISTHSAKEEDARTVVSNLVKVVVAIALSWSIAIFVIEQAQILEKAIYATGKAGENISSAMGKFKKDIKIDNIGLDNPSSTGGQICEKSDGEGFKLARLVVQDVSLFYFIVPLVIVLFTYIIRLAAMYVLLGLVGMAALGLFSPKIRKLFEMWYTKFITVLKIPLILAVFVSVAFILMDVIENTVAGTVTADSCVIALFGVFGKDSTEIFKNLVKYTLGVLIIIKGCHVAASNHGFLIKPLFFLEALEKP